MKKFKYDKNNIINMRLDKVKSFWISSNIKGALTKKSMKKALEEADDDFDMTDLMPPPEDIG